MQSSRRFPSREARPITTTFAAVPASRLHDAVAERARERTGLSGIHPLEDARAAFAARVALAEVAERSLDVQYYIWKDDVSGRLLMEALRRAAARGVRVRLLLDDNNTAGLDRMLAALDADPHVEIRLFNPFRNRALRALGYLTEFPRLNRRMHNKSFTADGVATIVGGRNVGDEYFAAGGALEFYDLDVMAVGAVVADVARSFDEYWNSESAYPVETLLPRAMAGEVARFVARGVAAIESEESAGYARWVAESPAVRDLLGGRLEVEWAEAHLVVDDPAKALARARPERWLLNSLDALAGEARRELHVVSPYLVPTRRGVREFDGLVRRGVRISVLTNAFESTDVAAVHAGYAKRRRTLLDSGVTLYELRRDFAPLPVARVAGRGRGGAGDGGGSAGVAHRLRAPGSASLHAKTFAIDRERLFVGSFNFDPRSAALNTEMGLLIRSPRLAGRLATLFDEDVPAASYRVRVGAGGGLEWVARRDGVETVLRDEPGMGLLQRCGIDLLARLPIEWLL